MKANFILGKKQIILASLVLILGVAVYLNWTFANSNEDLSLTSVLDETENPADAVIDETTVPIDQANTLPEGAAPVLDKAATPEDADKAAGAEPTAAVDKDAAPLAAHPTEADVVNSTAATDKTKNLGDTLLVSSKSIADETYFAMAKLARTKSRDEAIETISTVLNDIKLTDDDKKDVSAKALALTDAIEAESRIENLIKAKGFEECVVYLTDASANVVVKTDGLDQDHATQIKNIIVSEGKIKGENVTITEIN